MRKRSITPAQICCQIALDFKLETHENYNECVTYLKEALNHPEVQELINRKMRDAMECNYELKNTMFEPSGI